MTTPPTSIISHDKYHDILVTHPDHFERNIIGLGYAFEDEVLCHHIAVLGKGFTAPPSGKVNWQS